jgi:UPF0271 protein
MSGAEAVTSIDLNADLGEGEPGDAELLQVVSSCNIACGGHAGDEEIMTAPVRQALANGVAVGAHPGYPDREGFGRRSHFMSGEELLTSLQQQLETFSTIAAQLGATVVHVKPHGTLYTDAVADAGLANVIARAVESVPGRPALVGQAGTELEAAATAHGLVFIAEAFIDRAYQADGRLVPRSEAGAVHDDIERIKAQAVSLAVDGRVQGQDGSDIQVRADTLCIHGDTPGAAEAARAVREALESCEVEVRGVRR